MALLGMPILLINMGGEMVYILEQRLHAQSINFDKSKRVLQDVVRTLFNTKFIEELMKPQELYSVSSLRGIFDRLAHSSIMRLSESSMDKLFDLMTMGVKYQVICSAYPAELIDVTLNHMDSMKKMVDDKPLESLVSAFRDQFKQKYRSLSVGDFMELKQTLHSFFQDRRIKVSLFLQEGLQTNTGSMVFPEEEYLPPDVLVPDTIRTYNNGEIKTITIPYAGKAKVRSQQVTVRSKLGVNLYAKGKPTNAPLVNANSANPSPPTTPTAGSAPVSPPITEIEAPDAKPTSKIGAAELNLLAQLINTQESNSEKEAVRVNLFAGDTFGQYEVSNLSSTNVVLDATHEKNPYLSQLTSSLSVQNDKEAPSEGQDLLDLMDSAG